MHQNHGQPRTVSLTVCVLCWEEEKHRQQQSAWGARDHVCSEREERYGRVEEEWGECALELPERRGKLNDRGLSDPSLTVSIPNWEGTCFLPTFPRESCLC